MHKRNTYKICSNELIAKDVYKMILEGDTRYITAPGQFVDIEIDGFYLRRPISVCDWDSTTITLIYKVVGEGTARLSIMQKGTMLDMLTGLGNGYEIAKDSSKPVLIGGGVGVPPLYALAKGLLAKGIVPTVVLGFNTASEVFYQKEFEALGCTVYLSTADGSMGQRGFVTDVLKNIDIPYDYFYACGPEPMLKALTTACSTSGQLSFEARMACGFGACMGCSCRTLYGNKRICVDGPVLKKEEILW